MSGFDNTSETVRIVSGSTNVTMNDYIVVARGHTATATMTLPHPSLVPPGRVFRFYNDSGSFGVSIVAQAGGLTDGGPSKGLSAGLKGCTMFTDGTNWFTIGSS